MRRLTGDEHLSLEFATTWRTYDLDERTRTLLDYAEKLTKAPSTIVDADIDALRRAGWYEGGIYEATALASLFNFSGRLEAASGLPRTRFQAARVLTTRERILRKIGLPDCKGRLRSGRHPCSL